jgi:acetyl/propionyl-CoA carboxylase alpha subunit
MRSISKLLIANRGEIAARIMRTAKAMDITCVVVYSDADSDAPFVRLADEAVRLPGSAPTETYLRSERIVDAARLTDADAIHPGYGFLAEDAKFARACADAGLIFVGRRPMQSRRWGPRSRPSRPWRRPVCRYCRMSRSAMKRSRLRRRPPHWWTETSAFRYW